MTTLVRAASPPDASALFTLIQDHAAFERSAASLSASALETSLASNGPLIRLLVAEDDAVLVGYAGITFDWSLWRARRYGHLDCLFVATAARGRGIGKELLEAAARLASAAGADRLEWQTPAWNAGAIRFYLREGALSVTKERFTMELR